MEKKITVTANKIKNLNTVWPQPKKKKKTVIIGAGLSGLSCAIQLEKERRDYLLVEKANRIGGRLGSLYEEGNIYDIGFQVFNTAYKNTMQWLDRDKVKLKMFKPG